MQINPFTLLRTYLRGTREVKKGKTGGVSGYGPPSSDQVEISGQAQEVERLSATVSTEPDVRLERVEEVTQKIAEGKHNPTDKEMTESVVKSTIMDNML